MPELAEFGQILAAANDKILLVTVSTDESAQDARQTLMSVLQDAKSGVSPEEYRPPFVALVDSENDVVLGKYGTKLYPETWFIDPEGVIRARFDGPRDWSDALYLDLAESLLGPSSCRVSFPSKSANGVPEQCKDMPVAG
jgi:hypothetical protein